VGSKYEINWNSVDATVAPHRSISLSLSLSLPLAFRWLSTRGSSVSRGAQQKEELHLFVIVLLLCCSEEPHMRRKYEKVHTIRPTETRLDVPAIVEAHGLLGLHGPARAIAWSQSYFL
jgi:hypothetical protein